VLSLVKVCAVAILASLVLTPLVRRAAKTFGLLDHPDEHRKLHRGAMPLGGGVAVLLATIIAMAIVFAVSPSWRTRLAQEFDFMIGLALAMTTICIVGLLDDRFGLRGRQKLVGQFIAASVLLMAGLQIETLQVFHWRLELGLLAVPFTLFWLLGAVNALNLLDGMDGLASSVGIVLSAAIGYMAWLTGHHVDAILAIAIAGSLAGFLVYNSPPASIFLGDAGAMLIGLVIGALGIRCSLKGPATVALVAPTAILAVPIIDVTMAILRRKLTGRSIYATDRAHLHHSVQRRGLHGFRAVVFIGLLCALTGSAAVISTAMNNEWLAIGGVLAVFGMLVVTRCFGHHECSLLLRRTKQLVASLNPTQAPSRQQPRQLQTRFQGVQEWEELWETLISFANRFELSAVQLNVTLPAADEEYHASWQRQGELSVAEFWYSDIPLVASNVLIGRLKISGVCNHGSVCVWMGDLIAGLKPFEQHLSELIDNCVPRRPPPEVNAGQLRTTNATLTKQ